MDVGTQRGEDGTVETFDLTICLWVVCGCEGIVNFQDATNVKEELGCELFSVISQ